MDLFDAITKRHSYRGSLTDKPVSRDDLQTIVQAGINAPSGCNAQTTTFVIVDDTEKLNAMAEIMDKPMVSEAKAAIVCVVDRSPVYQEKSFAAEDCAAAVENMLLAITALGYATVWLQGNVQAENRAPRIAKLLGVPDNREVLVVLPIGEPAEPGSPKEKLPFDQRAWFNSYGK